MVDTTNEIGLPRPLRQHGYARVNATGALVSWVPGDDHVGELADPHSRYLIYDQMATDSRVASMLRAIMQPLISASWHIDPRNADDHVVDHIAESFNLPVLGRDKTHPDRSGGSFDWGTFIRHAFLSLKYGWMPFEIVHKVGSDGLLHLHKLAPRMPHTIAHDGLKTARDGGLVGLVQRGLNGGKDVTIPIEKLLIISHEMIDKDWRGTSVLRPIYADWKLKRHALKVNSVHVDRNGAGVVVATNPPTDAMNEAQAKAVADQMMDIGMSVRAGAEAAAAIPYGAKLELKGVYGTTVNILGTLDYHNAEISNSLLQFFANLANSSHGSHAQSKTVTKTYNASLNATATAVADTITAHVVEDLVTRNWGPTIPAPAIAHKEIGVDLSELVNIITSLRSQGVLLPDRETEEWIRREAGITPKGGQQEPTHTGDEA